MPLAVITKDNLVALKAVQVKKTTSGAFDNWESRPVWMVDLKGDIKLVIKAELAVQQGAGTSVKFGAKVMRNLDKETKAESLSTAELDVLASTTRMKYGTRGQGAQGGQIGVDYLKHTKSQGAAVTWVKMKFVENLVDLEGVFKDQQSAVDLLSEMKKGTEVVKSLGEIAAGDLFIGNEDRFGHGINQTFGSVVNSGNILLRKTSFGTRGVGLDWFEAQGASSNLTKEPPPNWQGLYLKNNTKLGQLALAVIDSMNEVFFSKIFGCTKDELLDVGSARSFLDGLESGREKLKQYLTNRRNAGKVIPSGVTKRMDLLGWK